MGTVLVCFCCELGQICFTGKCWPVPYELQRSIRCKSVWIVQYCGVSILNRPCRSELQADSTFVLIQFSMQCKTFCMTLMEASWTLPFI